MASEINGIRPGSATTPVTGEQGNLRTGARENSGAQPQAPQPGPAGAARAATDSVSLSQGAQALKALEERIQKLPEVDEKRVAQIKAALESGQYRVDDLVVADKLLNLDDLFK